MASGGAGATRRSEADGHDRQQELHGAVHPRPALQAGARGEGLQGRRTSENIGSSELIDTALKSGKINFYPEYTGVIVADLAKQTAPKTAAANYAAAKKFEESRGNTLLKRRRRSTTRDSFGMLTSTAKKLRREDDRRHEEGQVVLVRRLPGVPDAHHVPARPEEDLRPQAGQVRPAREHQRLHAARPGQDHRRATSSRPIRSSRASKYTVLEGHEAHLRVPERRTGRVEEARRGRRQRSREGRERGLREADARAR